MFTNINITGNNHQYHYIVEYNGIDDVNISNIYYTDDLAFWRTGEEQIIKVQNDWIITDKSHLRTYMPNSSYKSYITLYLPQFSPDVYQNGLKYALNIGTWIGSHYISLGSFIFDRLDALACDGVKTFMSEEYYECIKFEILDPSTLVYSDEWKEFRKELCEEIEGSNSSSSSLYFTLHIVNDVDGGYMKNNDYVGGQNSINISKKVDDYLRLCLNPNVLTELDDNAEPSFIMKLKFNHHYQEDLLSYIQETYGIQSPRIKYGLVIGNENDIYAVTEELIDNIVSEYTVPKHILTLQNFNNWDGWKPGIYVVGSVDILDENNDSVLYLLSNKIPFNQELFKYFVKSNDFKVNGRSINNVNLKIVDMNLYNIKTVNKIENQVIQISGREDTKANLIQPVFFRSVEVSSITIHPSVTETICINLDNYKSKVDTFIIQIDGVQFNEIGRNQSGVLFKIIGNKLLKEITSGTYFILDQNSELVTTGKYTYVY